VLLEGRRPTALGLLAGQFTDGMVLILLAAGLPGPVLAAEPEEPDVMQRPPRPPTEGVFAHGLGPYALRVGLLMAGLTLGAQAWFVHAGSERWQTMAFMVLCLAQLAHVLAIRSERRALVSQGLLSNRPLLGAVALTPGLQLATIDVPPLRVVFRTEPLGPGELAVVLAAAALVFAAVEVEKWAECR
jgi:Ca2+-transporting ATPase